MGNSLARRVFFETCGYRVDTEVAELGGMVATSCWRRTGSYLRIVSPLLDERLVRAWRTSRAGGITENLPRVLPDGCAAMVDPHAWATAACIPCVAGTWRDPHQ